VAKQNVNGAFKREARKQMEHDLLFSVDVCGLVSQQLEKKDKKIQSRLKRAPGL
jgi:hypothetical protein